VNTLVLITSSLTVALANPLRAHRPAPRGRDLPGDHVALRAHVPRHQGVEYAAHFHERSLPGKYYAYEAVKIPGAAMFFSVYFLMTGLHGVHVIAGMSVLSWILRRTLQGRYSSQYYTGLELGGLYWHPGGPGLDLPLPRCCT